MEYLHKFLPIIIYVLIMAIHYALSRTGIKLLGFVVPVIVTVGLIYTYKTGELHLNLVGTIIMIVISLLILAVEWENAQKGNKEN
ncbi:hypothetical protein [Staphylococcus capitis]|uniref:hypothetical protein n=1 Tax=Staphylococcus capitis TaxID=29388 RepID=UPI00066DCC30|nr:hypothetical protein [Staphylococcus capitis]MBC3087404.1 hypothetical protein [Staphylococcus capitis]MCK6221459.1 hypothetical protein [Staphylococcus capitis]